MNVDPDLPLAIFLETRARYRLTSRVSETEIRLDRRSVFLISQFEAARRFPVSKGAYFARIDQIAKLHLQNSKLNSSRSHIANRRLGKPSQPELVHCLENKAISDFRFGFDRLILPLRSCV